MSTLALLGVEVGLEMFTSESTHLGSTSTTMLNPTCPCSTLHVCIQLYMSAFNSMCLCSTLHICIHWVQGVYVGFEAAMLGSSRLWHWVQVVRVGFKLSALGSRCPCWVQVVHVGFKSSVQVIRVGFKSSTLGSRCPHWVQVVRVGFKSPALGSVGSRHLCWVQGIHVGLRHLHWVWGIHVGFKIFTLGLRHLRRVWGEHECVILIIRGMSLASCYRHCGYRVCRQWPVDFCGVVVGG